MEGLAGKVGKQNAALVPWPDSMHDTDEAYIELARFVSTLTAVKKGVKSANAVTMGNEVKQHHVPIFDDKGRLQTTIRKSVLENLYKDYVRYRLMKKRSDECGDKFIKEVTRMTTTYKINIENGGWNLHGQLMGLLQRKFKMSVQRIATPLTHHKAYETYYSKETRDKKFGAHSGLMEKEWTRDGLLDCVAHNANYSWKAMLSKAIQATRKYNTNTLVLIPLRKKRKQRDNYMNLLCHNTVTALAIWKEGEFQVVSAIDPANTRRIHKRVGLFMISKQSRNGNEKKFKEQLKKISVRLFGCAPEEDAKKMMREMGASEWTGTLPKLKKGNAEEKGGARHDPPKEERYTMRVGENVLKGAIMALGVKSMEDTMTRIRAKVHNGEVRGGSELCPEVKVTQIYKVKEQLEGLIVAQLDKHGTQLYVE